MQRKRTDTLLSRAARYFGVEDEPRTSIKVGRRECLIVLRRRSSGIAVAYYSEALESRIKAEYIWLTDAQRKALVEALDA